MSFRPRRFLDVMLALGLACSLGCGGSFAESRAVAAGGDALPPAPAETPADDYGFAFEQDAEPPVFDRGGVPKSALATPTPGAPASSPPAPGSPAPDANHRPKKAKKEKAPLLIYRATISLGVFEAKTGLEAIERLARKSGGYLVERRDSEITIRVPAKAFERTMKKVSELGDELHRDVRVSDVTAEFRDLEIRLDSARAVRARLEELLAKAANVSEALEVEKELERVSVEIETITGKLKLLRELVAFSTITVRFEARPTDQVDSRVVLPFPWLEELGLPNLLSL